MLFIKIISLSFLLSVCAFNVFSGDKPTSLIFSIPAIKKDILFGIYGGINFTQPSVINSYYVLSQADIGKPGNKTYSPLFKNRGFQFGTIAYLKLNDHFAVSLSPGVSYYAFHYNITNLWADSSTLQTSIYNFTNRFWGISLPVQLYYIFNPDDKLNFYATIGAKYEFIFSALKRGNYSETTAVNNVVTGQFYDSFKSKSDRMFIRSNFQTLAGVGMSYQFSKFTVFTEVDFVKGLNTITKKDNRYNDQRNLYTHPDIQDDILMNNMVINIGLLYKVFSAPKKLKCVTP